MTTLAFYEDLLAPGEARALPACSRVLYVASGGASSLGPNEAWFGRDEATLEAGHEGATVLRWELTDWEPEGAKLASRVELDPWAEYLVRCDRVDFPPGGIAYLHTHPGPGIRYLLHGALEVHTAGRSTDYLPGRAWFESGSEPVLAVASQDSDTAFVRVLLLPREWAGKRTIRYLDLADDAKPKLQRATILLEEPIEL
jgi:quercetin dioxygenase-like cupin family protein